MLVFNLLQIREVYLSSCFSCVPFWVNKKFSYYRQSPKTARFFIFYSLWIVQKMHIQNIVLNRSTTHYIQLWGSFPCALRHQVTVFIRVIVSQGIEDFELWRCWKSWLNICVSSIFKWKTRYVMLSSGFVWHTCLLVFTDMCHYI